MFKIISKKIIAENLIELDILAPNVAKNAKPGQFVMIRLDEFSERIPLTIVSTCLETDSVKIIFQILGVSTQKLGALNQGDFIQDFLGPLGNPSQIQTYGKVVCIGGGVGIAAIYSIAKALKSVNNKVYSILGVRAKEMLFLADEMRDLSDKFFITSNDGSIGQKGFTTDVLSQILETEKVDMIFAVGPIPMMQIVFEIAKKHDVLMRVSLEVLMLDGIGMCGACRITYDGKSVFACVDGPEFDAYKIDFSEITKRQKSYLEKEKKSLENLKTK